MMTPEQALAFATEQYDDISQQALEKAAATLAAHGATPEEMRAGLEWQMQALEETRPQFLGSMMAFLLTGSAHVH